MSTRPSHSGSGAPRGGAAPEADGTLSPRVALGRVVRRFREAAGMTQEALEGATRVHVTHIRAIESGRRSPSFDVVCRLASGLGVTLAALGAAVDAERSGVSDGG